MKPFKCEECSKGYYTKKDLAVHLRSHTGNNCLDFFVISIVILLFSSQVRNLTSARNAEPVTPEVILWRTIGRNTLVRKGFGHFEIPQILQLTFFQVNVHMLVNSAPKDSSKEKNLKSIVGFIQVRVLQYSYFSIVSHAFSYRRASLRLLDL